MQEIVDFSIENFRVFDQKTNFTIKPITILTGENNSGKSSMLKALMLLSYASKKEFSVLTTNDFDIKKSKPRENEGMNFEITTEIKFDLEEIEGILSQNEVTKQFFEDNKENTFFAHLELRYDKFSQLYAFGVSLSSNKFKKTLLYKKSKIDEKEFKENKIEIIKNITIDIDKKHLKEISYEMFLKESLNTKFWDSNSSKNINIDFLKPKNYNAEKEIGEGYSEDEQSYMYASNFIKLNSLDKAYEKIEIAYNKHLLSSLLSFMEQGLKIRTHQNDSFLHKILEHFLNDDFKNQFTNIEILDKEITNARYFNTSNKLFKYFEKLISKNYLFPPFLEYEELEKWLKQFEIGEKLNITSFEDQIIVVKLLKDGKEYNINDLGSGYLRLIYLIVGCLQLKGGMVFSEKGIDTTKKIIIIEEPELNLHPNLQSKLADFFVEMTQNHGCQFIIETHSEYLIRRLQFLTATQKIDGDKVAINYVNKPNKPAVISGDEPQVLKIGINSDGSLTQNFPTGFMDMADNIVWDLHNLNNPN